MDDEDRPTNPMEWAQSMLQQQANVQFNAAKVTISWTYHEHNFAVESMNPLAAFSMMEKVKAAAKSEFKKKEAELKRS